MSDEKSMVDDRHKHGVETAHSLEDAANSGESLQGYASINNSDPDSEIAQHAIEHADDDEPMTEDKPDS